MVGEMAKEVPDAFTLVVASLAAIACILLIVDAVGSPSGRTVVSAVAAVLISVVLVGALLRRREPSN
jgi:hypothetical protein